MKISKNIQEKDLIYLSAVCFKKLENYENCIEYIKLF